MADGIVRDLRPASVLDAGCAMGFLVEALRERGVEAWGVDISEYAISKVHESVAGGSSRVPGRAPLPGALRPDCLHRGAGAPAAGRNQRRDRQPLRRQRPAAVLRTPDDYEEATHLNVQPPEAWSALIAREGLLRDVERDASYITPWATLYTRAEEPLEETVRRYDRSWWRLRREGNQLRRSLLAPAQEQLAEFEHESDERQRQLERQPEVLAERERLRADKETSGCATC